MTEPESNPDSRDRRDTARPATGEAPFHPGEVFFSRTDRRGVILSANFVFQRVADYPWDKLFGAPHKIIRHPDMPRAVFWLLWNRILQGQVIGAYVKNRAGDGLHYWVYALVTPCGEGFLSARIKPTSPLRAQVEALYAELVQAEKQEGLTPEQSAARLLERLDALGFESYEEFMAHATAEELQAERQALNLPSDERIETSRVMLASARKLGAATEDLVAEFESLSIIPHNMQIAASRLEPSGGPFSTISRNYGELSRELSQWFAGHVIGPETNFASIATSVNDALLMESVAAVLHRCDQQLRAERRQLGSTDLDAERKILLDLAAHYSRRARDALAVIADEAGRIIGACKEFRRQMLGLSNARVACKIENARMSGRVGGLGDIIGKLESSQERVDEILTGIVTRSSSLAASAELSMRHAASATPAELLFGEKMAAALAAEGQGTSHAARPV